MKKIFNYIIAGCLATSFTGCLDMEPVSSITDVNYWKDAAQFEAFNVGLHGLLRERSYTISSNPQLSSSASFLRLNVLSSLN